MPIQLENIQGTHKKLLDTSQLKKGDRVLVNIGIASLPDFRVGTVTRRRNGNTGLVIKLDRGDSVQMGVTDSISGVVGKCRQNVPPRTDSVKDVKDLDQLMNWDAWVASPLREMLPKAAEKHESVRHIESSRQYNKKT